MSTAHTVTEGESLLSIAHDHGFSDWRTIWEHDDNAGLRAQRKSAQVLAPGDVVAIPDKEPRWETVHTNQRYTFQLLPPPPALLRIVVADEFDVPFAHCRFEVTSDAGDASGWTDAQGLVECTIPPDLEEATLHVELPQGGTIAWRVAVGGLDPIEEPSGVAARLANLGLLGRKEDAVSKPALEALQRRCGLAVTGELDEATRGWLRAANLVDVGPAKSALPTLARALGASTSPVSSASASTSGQQPATDVYNTSGQQQTNVYNTSGQQPATDVYNTSGQQQTNVYNTSGQQPATNVYNTSGQQPATNAYNTSGQQQVPEDAVYHSTGPANDSSRG